MLDETSSEEESNNKKFGKQRHKTWTHSMLSTTLRFKCNTKV